jgi:putative transposase
MSTTRRAYLYRLYPTDDQARALQGQLDVAREVYNACLLERREAYRMAHLTLGYYAQANQLKYIRTDRPDIASVNFSMLQAICRRAQRSYEHFFRHLRDWKERKALGLPVGKKPGPPRFKGYLRFNSITFPSHGDGCKLKGNRLYVQSVGLLKVKLHRPVGGQIKTVTVKRVARRWYAVVVCDVAVVPLPATGETAGIDLGLASFLMTDAGVPVPNPQPLRRAEARLRRAERSKARKRAGSNRRKKQRRHLARLHEKIANIRRDFHHQTARDLVEAFDIICHEDLRINNMLGNHSLAKSISDVGWGQFIAILVGKAAGAGRQTIAVDPRGTSQTCICGEPVPKDLSERWHTCPRCGLSLLRDQVSAMLVKKLGVELGPGSGLQALTWPVGACVA